MAQMSDVVIRRLGSDDWQLLRDLRLAALQESPAAFLSTYDREASFDEATWRSRLETSAYFVAEAEGAAIGMVCAYRHAEPESDGPPEMELVSMWVGPDRRRRGIGARLVANVLEYARDEGEPLVGLWVAAGNETAEALYRAAGFERTGEEQEMPGRPDGCEVKLTVTF